MNGIGNRIVVADLRGRAEIVPEAAAIRLHELVPFDQLMVLHDPSAAESDAKVRIYNNDGSSAGACGNGIHASRMRLFECRQNGF